MAMAQDALYAAKAAEQRQQYLDSVSAKEEKQWPLLSASEREVLKMRVGPPPQHPAPRKTLGRTMSVSPRDVKFFEDRRVFEAKEVETYKTMVLEKKNRTAAAPPVPVLTEAVVQVAAEILRSRSRSPSLSSTRSRSRSPSRIRSPSRNNRQIIPEDVGRRHD